MSNNHLNFAKKLKDDEYYTRRFLVDIIFKKTVEALGSKNVLYVLAADTDRSFYTKYAKLHQLHYVNNIDLYDATQFIYPPFWNNTKWTTCVITNPPFSKLIGWLKKVQPYVQSNSLQLCLIIPITTISTSSLNWYLRNCYFYPFNSKMNIFFHAMELKSVNTILMTTFELHDWPVHPKQPQAPEGDTFTTPITRIIYKTFYEPLGYHLVGVDPCRNTGLFKRYIWSKNKNNPS